jgi:Calcineurin-like phosphoesterase
MPKQTKSSKTKRTPKKRLTDTPIAARPIGNQNPVPTGNPQFGQPTPSPDPTKFVIKHGSDSQAYKILDTQKQYPRPFPVVAGVEEPILTLEQALGAAGTKIVSDIQSAGQIVFHSVGDTGNVRGPADESSVADKMLADFDEPNPREVPSFFFHLGDVVYSFGEAKYYYDQFYDIFRDYPAPIFAIAGNHDGMVAPKTDVQTLAAFLENFCANGQPPHRTPEAGELVRTAQIQPGVYFTFEAPFVRILSLYSNTLEDPGIISDEGGAYPYLGQTQLNYLRAALQRTKTDNFTGAILIAVHHPPYVALKQEAAAAIPGANAKVASRLPVSGGTFTSMLAGNHGNSSGMLKDIDSVCVEVGVWPHAVLSGHAHNYQRFTRTKDGRQTPFIVAGNGGHAIATLTKRGMPTLRTPARQDALSDGTDQVVFENYDDQDFGYTRILVNQQQLRIEYHPASDGAGAKTPDDSVTVDLKSRQLVPYIPPQS